MVICQREETTLICLCYFYHPFSVGKIRLIIEQKRLFLFNGGRRDNKKCTTSQSQVQRCEREPSGQGIPPGGGQESRKLARKNSTSQLCIGDSYVFAGHFSIYESYFQCCLFIQFHPTIVISHPSDLFVYCFTLLACSITYNSYLYKPVKLLYLCFQCSCSKIFMNGSSSLSYSTFKGWDIWFLL